MPSENIKRYEAWNIKKVEILKYTLHILVWMYIYEVKV